MKRRFILLGLMVVLVSLLISALILPGMLFAAEDVLLSRVDFSSDYPEIGDFIIEGAEESDGWGATKYPGNYGGKQDDSCMVWEYGLEADNCATVTLATPQGAAKTIIIEHLDGSADDSFDVEVKNVHGEWILVGSYTGLQDGSEDWVNSEFDLSLVEFGRGRDIQINITVTADPWRLREAYGQLAIDWIELRGNGKPRAE